MKHETVNKKIVLNSIKSIWEKFIEIDTNAPSIVSMYASVLLWRQKQNLKWFFIGFAFKDSLHK